MRRGLEPAPAFIARLPEGAGLLQGDGSPPPEQAKRLQRGYSQATVRLQRGYREATVRLN
jgi:hypothetical protein